MNGPVTEELPAQEPAVLAIDGGNSKTDVALVAADGTLLAQVRGGRSNFQGIGMDEAFRVLDGLVRTAAREAGVADGALIAEHTSACLAGADLPDEEQLLTDLVHARGWSRSSLVVNDTFAVLRAGVDDAGGRGHLGRRRHLRRGDQLRGRGAGRARPPGSCRWATSAGTGAAAATWPASRCGGRPGPRTAAGRTPSCARPCPPTSAWPRSAT